jgi:hypothetical protein
VVESLARKQFDDYVKRVRVFVHPDQVSAIAPFVENCLREMLDS